MKKLSVTLALVLCLVLCAFAFASCGKDKTDATTAPKTTAPGATTPEVTTSGETDHVHVRADEMTIDRDPTCTADGSKSYHCTVCSQIIPETVEAIPALGHTPKDHYTTDTPATCISAGSESIHCFECGEIILTTVREIAIDPEAHNIATWVEDDISLLNPTGNKTGHCSICDRDIVKAIAYQPTVWNANDKTSGNKVDKRLYSAIRGEDHFYPAESNGNLGNDLLIEFSILYNETLSHGTGWTFDITVGDGSDFVNLKLEASANARYGTVVGGFSARDRNDGKGAILSTPSAAAIAADPNAKYPSIGEYGWHRVAIRIHQEADIVDDAVAYTYTGEAYLDGNLILAFDLSKWASGNTGALLFTAEIVDGNLVYADNANASAKANITIANYYKGSDNYLVIADEYMTCGKEFVRQVKPVAHPTATTDPSVTGVALPATTWYARTSGPIPAGNYTHTGFTSSDRVTVMSYNIEKCDGGWDGRDPAKAIQTILDASPDIAGLQEVNANWNGNLATLTSNGYARISGDTTTGNWPELYYKTERFTEQSHGYKRYSTLKNEYPGVDKNGADPSRDGQGRLFTWAMLEENATGKKILAISTHLHYRVNELDTASSEANTLVRQYEIRLMLAWIADQPFEYDAVVVVGDMNEHYLNTKGKATTNIFRESGFAVARDVAAIKGDVGGTMTKSGRSKRDGMYIFDLILIRGNVEATYYTVADNKTDNGGTTYPSDHVPIVTEFRFR